jgi:hypothetical protein
MHGLPADFDGQFFVGKDLIAVTFSANTVSFSFDGEVLVTAEAPFKYKATLADPGEVQPVPAQSSTLMRLLQHQVHRVSATTDGTLELTFDDGQMLIFVDDSGPYESYHVKNGDSETHV